jgi:hypothetical protein
LTIVLESLRHLLAISFAVGLAYIALDRFRYYRISKEKLTFALAEVESQLKEKSAARDTSVARLKNKKKEISEQGLGPKLFIFFGPKVFGCKKNSGYDVLLICILASVQYLALSLNCFFSFDNWVYFGMFVIAVVGTVTPVILILYGSKEINEIESFIARVLRDLSDTYTIPIAQMQENLDKTD